MKELNPDVFVAEGGLVKVNRETIDFLKGRADLSQRYRARLCAHPSESDPLHEMLIVLRRGVYIRPHKHFGKTESFHVIEGSARVVFFDENGGVDEVIDIGDVSSRRVFYFRSCESRYHTQIVTSEHLVFHETTNGPFRREDTAFAPWAPPEGDALVTQYLEQLGRSIAEWEARAGSSLRGGIAE